MKLKKFLFFLLVMLNLFQHLQLSAQDRVIDSLKLALKNAKHDTTRCNTYLSLGMHFYFEKPDTAIMLWQKAQLLAEKNLPNGDALKKCYLKKLAKALNNIGIIYKDQGDIPKALVYYHKSLKIQEEVGNKIGMTSSLNNIGVIYFSQGEISKAKEYWHKCLKISEEVGHKKGVSNSLNNFGLIYKDQGDIPKALEFYHKSLKIQEEIGDKSGIAGSLNNIGNIYKDQGDRPKSLECYYKGLKIYEEIGDKQGISLSLNSIGNIYSGQGNIPKALEYFHKSLKIEEEIGDKRGIATSLNGIGFIYEKQGYILKALENYHKCLKIYEEIGDEYGTAVSLNNIGDIYHKQSNLKEGLTYANRSMNISKELGYPENIENSAILLKLIFQKQNKYKEAFEMYELEIKMRDSINNQETQKAAVKKQMQYTYEKKAALDSTAHAKENDIKNAEITARKAELKVKQNTQYALYSGLALVLIFAGFMFNRFKVTQKQKHIIEIKEKETQQQKHIIEEKHKEITDSINYAERIQRSFIATKEMLDENLDRRSVAEALEATDNYFVLFKPKDIVSGDFYWAHKLNNGNFALATADSTGHGVPGAIMSLLNITSLEKAIETLTEPADILNSTRKTIIERLKKDGSEHGGKDGMDASLCVFDFKNKKLIVAAANNPVWIVRSVTSSSEAYREVNSENSSRYENSKEAEFSTRTDRAEVIEIKPDKMPVGKHDNDTVSFTQQTIDLQSGDVVYTLTDGFPDQFGGEKGKKFMSKNLKQLLAANSHLPMYQQKQILEKTFANWVGDLEQVDDVTLIGVRI